MIKFVLTLSLVAIVNTQSVLRISPVVLGSPTAGQQQVIYLSGGGGVSPQKFSAQPYKTQSAPVSSAYVSKPTPAYQSVQSSSYKPAPVQGFQTAPKPAYQSVQSPNFKSAPVQGFQSAPKPAYQSAQSPSYKPAPVQGFQTAPKPAYQLVQSPSYKPAPVQGFQSAPKPTYQSVQSPSYKPASVSGVQTPQVVAPSAAYQSAPVSNYKPNAAVATSQSSYSGESESSYPRQPFGFAFDSEDEYGTKIGRQESGDQSGTVTGSYTLSDATGIARIVTYVADANGFRAEVKTNEPGTFTSNPADVSIQSSAVPQQ